MENIINNYGNLSAVHPCPIAKGSEDVIGSIVDLFRIMVETEL
jgi:hypothetical protein